ncbi:hypothetical protein AMTRI_Chr01g104930 [Amborella trichopoda]
MASIAPQSEPNGRTRPEPTARPRRDEWSDGAISTLLGAYQSKWVQRNRAKLKSQDWADVARHVSSRGASSRAPKTLTQCKNKIESMKRRYRSESSSGAVSTWPLFHRLDLLLRCSKAEANGEEVKIPESQEIPAKIPANYELMSEKKRKGAASWVMEALMSLEERERKAMREIERVRAELEAKRVEMEKKETAIMASTQLEIEKLISDGRKNGRKSTGKGLAAN